MDDFSTPAKVDSLEQRNPITLTMLFYVLTAAAILAACYRYIAFDENGTSFEYAVSSAIGGVVGLMIGTIQLFRRSSHAWMSPVVGLFLGVAVGPLLRIQLTHFGTIIGISFFGSWMLVLIMSLAARLNQR